MKYKEWALKDLDDATREYLEENDVDIEEGLCTFREALDSPCVSREEIVLIMQKAGILDD